MLLGGVASSCKRFDRIAALRGSYPEKAVPDLIAADAAFGMGHAAEEF
jgi:hypothetical protein